MKTVTHKLLVVFLVTFCSAPAFSQFSLPDIFRQTQSQQTSTAAADAPPVAASAAARSELSPDSNCSRPRESFGIADKLAKYGGTAASLRLTRLIQSDFEFSKLTREDKEMLRYLAQTTVWIPAEIESKLGAIYDTSTGFFGLGGPRLTDDQKVAFQEIEEKLEQLKKAVPDYPAEIRLRVDKSLTDGAFARFGGVILLSERFLNGLGDAENGGDFLLAHEVSHVYKRHALKSLQFNLISSEEGWVLAKDILKIAMGGQENISIFTIMGLGPTIAKLVESVKGTQMRFGREQELEADGCSKVWLSAVGKDPVAAFKKFYEILGAFQAYSGEHPSTPEREMSFLGGRRNAPPVDKGTATNEIKKSLREATKKK
jgi:Zn-dependent protease with chaperone function